MLDGQLLDKLNYVAQTVRRNSEPFGGIQVILCGDFYQLPPVKLGEDGCCFCFEATCWREVVQKTFQLTEIRRQRDPAFIRLLDAVRHGALTDEAIGLLDGLGRTELADDGIHPTRLHAHNVDVDRINANELCKLPGGRYTYTAQDTGRESLLRSHRAPPTLDLTVDAQVSRVRPV